MVFVVVEFDCRNQSSFKCAALVLKSSVVAADAAHSSDSIPFMRVCLVIDNDVSNNAHRANRCFCFDKGKGLK